MGEEERQEKKIGSKYEDKGKKEMTREEKKTRVRQKCERKRKGGAGH